MTRIEDAGHGGTDPGAVAKGNVEKVYTLEAAQYVAKRLWEHGIKTDLSRNADVTLDETPRVNKVKKYKYCNSHHYNAGGGSGAEVIISQYADRKYADMIVAEFKAAGYPVRNTPVFTKKGKDGKDYYYMHRRTGACNTTIIEYDFVDGPQAEKIKDKSYREGMYECVVKAVCRLEGVAYKSKGGNKVAGNQQTVSAWAKEAHEWVKKEGISDGSRPQDPVTRQEVWSMIYRMAAEK